MIRIVIENLILLLLPTLIYFGYVFISGGMRARSGKQILNEAPLIWLLVSGVLLAGTVVAIFSTFSGGKPGEPYRPAELRDGKIVPGRIGNDSSQEQSPKE